MNLALIGYPLSHSWSKQYFDNKFATENIHDSRYSLSPLTTLNHLRQWIAEQQIDGFNVTIPYKEAVLPLLDDISPEASKIGAVNCVKVVNNKLIGYNTDAIAFRETLLPLLQPWHHKAFILGTGGAAKAVAYVLQQLGIAYSMVSRRPNLHTIGYSEASAQLIHTPLIINATPVGMYPNIEATPLPTLHGVGSQHLCYDLIYNPEETRLLRDFRLHQAQTQNGLPMLHRQAALSWNIWTT